jgi:hypothetical protein
VQNRFPIAAPSFQNVKSRIVLLHGIRFAAWRHHDENFLLFLFLHKRGCFPAQPFSAEKTA